MFCFVLGTGCCGSSLVQEILARHPDMGFLSNIDDLGALPAAMSSRLSRVNNAVYRGVQQDWTRKGRARFAPSEGYRALAREVSPILAFPDRALVAQDADPWLAARMRRFFQSRARSQGKQVFLHKFTGHSRAGLIEAVLPGSTFIHIVRDGRAVAGSLVRQNWWTTRGGQAESWRNALPLAERQAWESAGRSAPLLAGLAWQLMIDQHDEARAELPPDRWLELRYEDVVAAPEQAFARMLAHVRLEPTATFETALKEYSLDPTRSRGFREELSPRTLKTLDHHLGAQLRRLGYSVED